jgi:hypothetical protein
MTPLVTIAAIMASAVLSLAASAQTAPPAPVLLGPNDPGPSQPPPSPGGWPDATNTGWQHTGATLAAYSGPSTITVDGTTIDSKLITGDLCIKASNVRITRSEVRGAVSTSKPNAFCDGSAPTNVVLEDVKIVGPGTSSTHNVSVSTTFAVNANGLTCRRCDISRWGSGVFVDGWVAGGSNVLIEDSYLHDFVGFQGCVPELGPDCLAHRSGIGGIGAVNATYRRNNIHINDLNGEPGLSGAIVIYGQAPVKNVLVEDNLIYADSASYCLYCGTDQGNAVTNLTCRNNVFNKDPVRPQCGYFGPMTHYGASISGNKFSDGTPIP